MTELNEMSRPMKAGIITALICLLSTGNVLTGCGNTQTEEAPVEQTVEPASTEQPVEVKAQFPKIASWLAKKEQLVLSGKPYSLVMTGWVTPEEAASLRENNPAVQIYAGLTCNWVFDNDEWMEFLTVIASYGRETPFEVKESMYLKNGDGTRCAFGWASEEWGHEEIYAMDPRNTDWIEMITAFYRNVLEQPQHDGIIVDMVTEKSWCPQVIRDEEWVASTKAIMARIQEANTENKPVIFNSGRDFREIDEYSDYMDGYLMENFLGEQFGTMFDEGLAAADTGYIIIYAADTDDAGIKDLARMRLGLTLSLLNDNTYITYDVGARDHGDAWWFPEYDVDLGLPLGCYYREGSGYRRDFEKGTVVCAPYKDITVVFFDEHKDISTGQRGTSFTINKGDGRIFIK